MTTEPTVSNGENDDTTNTTPDIQKEILEKLDMLEYKIDNLELKLGSIAKYNQSDKMEELGLLLVQKGWMNSPSIQKYFGISRQHTLNLMKCLANKDARFRYVKGEKGKDWKAGKIVYNSEYIVKVTKAIKEVMEKEKAMRFIDIGNMFKINGEFHKINSLIEIFLEQNKGFYIDERTQYENIFLMSQRYVLAQQSNEGTEAIKRIEQKEGGKPIKC